MYHLSAKWIGHPELCLGDWRGQTYPALVFRKCFSLDHLPEERVQIRISGLGFYDLYINGQRCPDRLVPSMSHYDRRWYYRTYDVSDLLKTGTNVIVVWTGNGLYNCQTPEVWQFDKAPWRDYPKLWLRMEAGAGKRLILQSDASWIVRFAPILYDSLRGGEVYDARLEQDWHSPEQTFEQKAAKSVPGPKKAFGKCEPVFRWLHAELKAAPGGIMGKDPAPPCRVQQILPMKSLSGTLYEAPFNLSGWPRIHVHGQAGAKITLLCGELLSADRSRLDNRFIDGMAHDPYFQKDVYILKGGGPEVWEPRFTYHGFQYVQVSLEGDVTLDSLEACVVHTDFAPHGNVRTEDDRIQWLHEAAVRSCLGNYVSMPTDCPHREKNGWLSEAQLMQELLLYGFDAAPAYHAFAEMIADAQRPSGQLPGMVPSAGYSYNALNGPVYDSALFEIPYANWLFTGTREYFLPFYPQMCKYLDFCESITNIDGLIRYGLGDWVPPYVCPPLEDAFVQNAMLKHCYDVAILCARMRGLPMDADRLQARADRVRASVNRVYYKGNGRYASDRTTACALALQFHIVPERDRKKCAFHLAETVRRNQGKVDFGTVGSKAVPRALLENGYADEAFLLMTQANNPGYQFWKVQGATTFPELWARDCNSLNHGAFADIAACLFRYFGGFRHDPAHPGMKYLLVQPCFPRELPEIAVKYGDWSAAWRRENGSVRYCLTVPEQASCALTLPGEKPVRLAGGVHTFVIS